MRALLRRELLGILRARRFLWVLAFAVTGASLFPLLAWPAADSSPESGPRSFAAFACAQLTGALIVAVALAAETISGERERGTLEMLWSSPVSPGVVHFAKAAAAAVVCAIFLAAMAPITYLYFLAGGVSPGGILFTELVTFLAVLEAIAASLVQSGLARTSREAMVRSALWTALWAAGAFGFIGLGVWWISPMFGRESALDPRPPRRWFDSIEMVLIFTLTLGAVGVGIAVVTCPLLSPYLLVAWTLHTSPAFACLVLASSRFWYAVGVVAGHLVYTSRRETRERGGQDVVPEIQRAPGPVWSATYALLLRGLLAWRERTFGTTRNAVLLKELRTERYASQSYEILAIALGGVALVSGWIALGTFRGGWTGLLALALLAAPVIVAPAVARERELACLDHLRSTLLTPREVLAGKLLGGFAGVSVMIALPAAFLLLLDPLDVRPPLIVLTTLFSAACVSLVGSTLSRTSLQALLLSAGLLFAFHVVLPLGFQLGLGRMPPSVCAASPFFLLRIQGRRLVDWPWNALGMFFAAHGAVAAISCSIALLSLRSRDR